jgi:2-keto-4-pentenoate hydratase/2-oxohepta-3-ene-1,7-dioic acid hydratase in catechol pathway
MKICRFQRSDHTIGWGFLTSSGIQDIAGSDTTLPIDTLDLIANWSNYESRVLYLSKRLGVSEEPLRILCPLSKAGKILCIGLNYRDHAIETKATIPTEPIVFSKMSTTLIGDGDDVVLPSQSNMVDYEAELVAVIGKTIKNVDEQNALDAVFGYSVGNDISARDWQKDKPGKQWLLGKSFDTFAPLGPAIAKADSILDPSNLKISCRVNGQTLQSGNTSDMIFGPATVISYISQVMTLYPGDIIYTGTPAGVGMARNPQRFLQPGDRVEVEIEDIGTLTNSCIQG